MIIKLALISDPGFKKSKLNLTIKYCFVSCFIEFQCFVAELYTRKSSQLLYVIAPKLWLSLWAGQFIMYLPSSPIKHGFMLSWHFDTLVGGASPLPTRLEKRRFCLADFYSYRSLSFPVRRTVRTFTFVSITIHAASCKIAIY